MFCQTCGKQIEDGSQFCPYCGSLQETSGQTQKIPVSTGTVVDEQKTEEPVKEAVQEGTKTVSTTGPKKKNNTVMIIAAVAVLALVGVGAYFVSTNSKGGSSSSSYKPSPVQEPVVVEEPVPQETVKPAEHDTYQDSSSTVTTPTTRIEIIAGNIKIRDYPSTKTGNHIGKVSKGQTYDAYESTYNEGYTWYRIGNNQWIADQNGEWVKVLY